MSSTESNGMSLTPTAEAFIRRLIRMSGKPQAGFHLRVSPGGCSGLSAEFSVENQAAPTDRIVEVNHVRLFLPDESYSLLEGVTIDFVDNRIESGFKFLDPKAEDCACKTGNQGVQLSTSTPAKTGHGKEHTH